MNFNAIGGSGGGGGGPLGTTGGGAMATAGRDGGGGAGLALNRNKSRSTSSGFVCSSSSDLRCTSGAVSASGADRERPPVAFGVDVGLTASARCGHSTYTTTANATARTARRI